MGPRHHLIQGLSLNYLAGAGSQRGIYAPRIRHNRVLVRVEAI
jgi:hypothetical protein